MTQSLDGYLWAVSPMNNEKMEIRCLTESTVTDIKPPLTLICVGNGCEVYSSNLYIPAKSELTSQDDSLTQHNFFSEFSDDYQNISRYSMIENLHHVQLTPEELANLPNRLPAMPPLKYQLLMEQVEPINKKYPFSIHLNILPAMLLGMGIMILASMTHVAWRIYQVRSRIKGFKPMTQWFQMDNQGNFLQQNLKITPDQLMKIVQFIQNPAMSVVQKLDAIELSASKAGEAGKVPISFT